MDSKYPVGAKVICNECLGIIVKNFKLPSDICIRWENGLTASYDEEWLDRHCKIVEKAHE